MWKYIRLMRLQDQYTTVGGALAAGIYLNTREPWIVVWAISCTFISIGTFILNELIDRQDVDTRSWNPIHIGKQTPIQHTVALILVAGFTVTGLALSISINMFWWALLMAVWYGLYSLPRVRLKTVFLWDIVTQIGAGWIIPFGVPILITRTFASDWMIIIATSALGWAIILPYQLADFTADTTIGFRSTHVVLGIQKSLIVGVLSGTIGILLFVFGGGLMYAPWIGAMVFLTAISMYLMIFQWRGITSVVKQELAFRRYWRFMKPLSQSLLPYVIILWFVW